MMRNRMRGGRRAFVVAALWLTGCRHPPPTSTSPEQAVPVKHPPGPSAGIPQALVPPIEERGGDVEWGRVTVNMNASGGVVTASVEMKHPRLWIFRSKETERRAAEARKAIAERAKAPEARNPLVHLETQLRQVLPAEVDRIDIYDAEMILVDMTQETRPQLWVHDVAISIENLTTRRWLADGRPVLLAMSGIVQNSGKLTVFVSADPYGNELSFAGRAGLVGLQTRELFAFIKPATGGLQAPQGTVNMFTQFSVQHGEINGTVTPIIENLVITSTEQSSALTDMKAWLADATVKLASNRVPGQNAVATEIPIHGQVGSPDAKLWPTLIGVLRNAFVEGLSGGFAQSGSGGSK